MPAFIKSREVPVDASQIAFDIVEKHPIELEEPIETLKRPLIIECACPGWQSRMWAPSSAYGARRPKHYAEGGVRYGAVPCSIEDQVRELVEAVKAGCAAIHVHPRDPRDCIASDDLDLLATVYDAVLSEVDAISIQHTWCETVEGPIDYLKHTNEMVEKAGGNRYCQGAVVLWPPTDAYPPLYTKAVQEGVRLMEQCGIKPVHKLRSAYHVRQMHRVLLETGVETRTPHVLVHDMGHPFGWPMDQDPWMPIDLITSIVQTKQRIPDSVVGVFSGGRNWMPITMTAILAGVDLVRVGIEDCYWMYPHLDDVIEHNLDCVRKITDFCKSIGRPLATPKEARDILGMTRTS